MPSSDPRQFLFSALRLGREGVICERSLRALSYIFHGWSYYEGGRPSFYGKPDNGILPIIEFEKLALFWCRIWARLWAALGTPAFDNKTTIYLPDDDTRLRFPQPFVLVRAKHGKRPQRFEPTAGPITLADILFGQQQTEFGKRYFDVRPFWENGIPLPNDYKTEVHRCIPKERRPHLLASFNAAERQLLEELDDIIRRLGALELRALGTHDKLLETLSDIEFEFDNIQQLCKNILRNIDNKDKRFGLGQDLLEYADEAFRKASENKENYRTAFERFATDIKNPFLRTAFEQSQETPDAIWNTSQMTALAARSELTLGVAKCFVAVSYFADHPTERVNVRSKKARQMKHHWDEGTLHLKRTKELRLPTAIGLLYVSNTDVIKPEIVNRFQQLLGLIQR